jgi:hypothetical protein
MPIIFSQQDGRLAVFYPSDNSPETYQREFERIAADGNDPEIVDWTDIPASREFRDAWKKGVGKVDIDMATARTIHMDRIRKARDKALKERDVKYLLADESGDSARKAVVAAQKQYLRDIPQNFDLESCQTPEELSAAWPPGLDR